jgi:hypothetical protein
MQCRNCSGNEFRQTGSGNYQCSYCGTLFYEETKNSNLTINRNWKKLLIPLFSLSVSIIAASMFFTFTGRSNDNDKKSNSNNQVFTNEEKLPDPKGEIISVDSIPDTIGNVYFLAMCRNSGKVAVNRPEITIRLFSDKDEKIASGKGYAFIDRLNPGEITPVYILVTNCPAYKKYEIDFTPELPFIIPEGGIFKKKFSGEFIDVSLRQIDSFNNHKLRGMIKNISEYDAKYVQVAAILYDKNDKAVGYGSAYINEKTLKPGSSDFFEIYLTTVKEQPEYYKLYFDGNVD